MGCRKVSNFILLPLLVLTITIPPLEGKGSATSTPSSPTATPNPVPILVQKTCKSTKYYDLCVSSLRSDPTSPTADTKGLALIMVGVAAANATSTSAFLSSLVVSAAAGGGNPAMARLLKDCADKYSLAGSSLQDSAQDLGLESYDSAYLHILAAQDYPNTCRNAFKRARGPVYPPELARREDGLKRMCDVALGIVDVLASQQ